MQRKVETEANLGKNYKSIILCHINFIRKPLAGMFFVKLKIAGSGKIREQAPFLKAAASSRFQKGVKVLFYFWTK